MSCTNLKKVAPLDGQPSPPPSLKEIQIYADGKKWWESLEWEHPNANNFLRPFADIRRDELIANFFSEELMDTRLSRRAEYDQGHAILNKLEKACLVEIWTDREVVRMHDLIRDMALTITKHNPRYMVKLGLELTKIPKIQNWTEDLDKVSLMDNSIHDFSPDTSPKCPRLSSMILSKNYLLMFIPECFFEKMRGLCSQFK
ncbi:putative disease resistance protein [Forsythia ovata]|uniref:Disease resistance protein n=1 Tax=Forsythia ovata TaxID=205694 RepID=A0ABD1UYJ7_9LAMI